MNATQLLTHFDRLAEAPTAVPRLRRFILDLAVRGKLVAQDAGDEPAGVLLTRIDAERLRLLNKPVKGSASPAIEPESTDIELPVGWAWSRLGSLCTKTGSGSTPSGGKDAYVSSGVPFLRSQNVYDEGLRLDGVAFISESTQERMSSTTVKPGDLLLNITGGSIGRCAVVPDSFVIGNINQHVAIIRPALLESGRFLHSVICSDYFQKHIFGNQTGAGREGLPKNRMDEILIPVAPLSEQHRIVAKVDELMALFDQLEAAQQERERRRDRLATASLQRLNHPDFDATPEAQREHARFHLQNLPRLITRPVHIKAMRQTLRKLAIAGQITRQDISDDPASGLLTKNLHWRAAAIKRKQIRDPRKELLPIEGNESPYLLPSQWCWARLGEVIYIQSGDGLTAANMKDGSIPVFGGNGVNGHHESFNVHEPTLVIGRVGYYCGSIHITPDRAWVTDNAFVTHFCPDLFSLRFLALLLATTNLKENEGATAQPVISGSKIYPLVIGIPPLAEQHRIVAKVGELMALCDQLEAQLTTTQTDSRRLLEAVLEAALAPA